MLHLPRSSDIPVEILEESVPSLQTESLVAAFEVPDDDDWDAWLDSLCQKLCKTSTSTPIRASSQVAGHLAAFRRLLINMALYNAWTALPDAAQSKLCKNIEDILQASASLEVHDTMLQYVLKYRARIIADDALITNRMVDFLDRKWIRLPISPALLKDVSLKRHLYHRSWRYAELEYEEAAEAAKQTVVADILRINQSLAHHEPDAALGFVQNVPVDFIHTEFGQWHTHMQGYRKNLERDPSSLSDLQGVIRVQQTSP